MHSRKRLLFLAAVSALGLAALLFFHEGAAVPLHYGLSGQADAYGSKWALLALAAPPFMGIGAMALTARFADKAAAEASGRAFAGLTLFFVTLCWLLAAVALGGQTQFLPLVPPGLSLLLGALLCYLAPILRDAAPNRLTGIRTKATLSDPVVWQKTHRLAAKTVLAGGLVLMAAAAAALLLPKVAPVLLAIGLCAAVLGLLAPAVYADRLARKSAAR